MNNPFLWLKDWLAYRRPGLLPQPEDKRDYRIAGTTALKESVDLRKYFLEPRSQGSSQACTGFATAAVFEHLEGKAIPHLGRTYFSPLYNWYYAKKKHGWEDENKGAWLRNSFKALYQEGVPPESIFPFTSDYLRAPSKTSQSFAELSRFVIKHTNYYLIDVEQVKQQLSNEVPVVFGLFLNNSFYGNRSGVIKDSAPDENAAHAMVAVGYKDGNIIVRNSWGAYWGDGGYCYIPESYFNTNSFDHWCIDLKDRNAEG